MDLKQLTRRRFMVSVIALSGPAGSALLPGVFSLSRAWARSPAGVEKSVLRAMVRMARLLYPHDVLSDEVYADVLDQALSDTAKRAEFTGQLEAAAAALDSRSGGAWQELDESMQIAAMRDIETESYFGAVQNQVRAGIYNGQAFWKHVGFPGPSKGFGGYLHRGAGEIDWLPEGS